MAQFTTTYAGLVSLLQTYVEDTSTEYASAVQGCINRAEERILRDLDLAIWNITTSTTTTTSQNYTSKGFTESPANSVFFTAAGEHALRRSRDYVQAYGGSGRPLYFYETDTRIYWAPTPDASYTVKITYLDRPNPLSGSNTTNWIAENAADSLLWAALIESEKFLIAPERVQEFEQSYAQTIGPLRAFWRDVAQTAYEPIAPVAAPVQTR